MNRRNICSLIGALFLLCNVHPLFAAVYEFDPLYSSISFKVKHLSGYTIGLFNRFGGVLEVDDATGQPVLVDSITPAAQKILTGEVPIGFTFTKYVVIFGKEGAKLDYVKVDKMLGDGQYLGVSSKPPHPNAAQLFIDYFLSEEGMKILADVGETVTRKGVYPALKDAGKIKFQEFDDLDEKGFAEKTQEYRKIFFQ